MPEQGERPRLRGQPDSCPPGRVLPKHLHPEGHANVVRLRRKRLRKAQVKGKVESCAVDRQVKIGIMGGGHKNSPAPGWKTSFYSAHEAAANRSCLKGKDREK